MEQLNAKALITYMKVYSVLIYFARSLDMLLLIIYIENQRLKKIKSNDSNLIITFRDGKKMLYGCNVNYPYGYEIQ